MSLFIHEPSELLPYDFGAVLHSNVWDEEQSHQMMAGLTTSLEWQQVVVEVDALGGRADAAVFFGDELFGRERLVRGIAPQVLPHALVQALGKGFGQAVGQPGHVEVVYHGHHGAAL